jgi:SPP1 gp7 family putative phage head morphogenesis protein
MPDPKNLWELQDEYKRKLAAGEREQINHLVKSYGEIWVRAKKDLEQVLAKIAEAQQSGQPISLAWIYQEERALTLMAQAQWEIAQWSRGAEATTVALQRFGIDVGAEEAATLLDAASIGGTFVSLPRAAVDQMVGFTADGTPLSRLFDEIAPGVRDGMERALIVGIGTGQHPTEVARMMRREFSVGLSRATLIARTEMLRAWRESSRQTYQANQDVVAGWIWHAERGPNTCASCLAMDGTFHTMDERLDDHPNGRCAMMPVTRSWNELGFTGIKEVAPPPREDTEDWLRSQPMAVQDKILGQGAAALWRSGKISLSEFTEQVSHPFWGTMRVQRSLKKILQSKP